MKLELRQLSENCGSDVYTMLQRIGPCENEFKNPAHGMTYEKYRDWMKQQDDWSKGINLPDTYVAQTIFVLFDDEIPVGIGKLRHELNEHSRLIGGNVGYAIDPQLRGKGYATVLLKLLLEKAKEIGIKEILLTVEKYNPSSRRVIEKNGGKLIKENDQRWYFTF